MLPPSVAQKNGNDFQIIFARFVFLSCNTGLRSKAPQISSLAVSVTAYFNVSLKCLVTALRNCACRNASLFPGSGIRLKYSAGFGKR